MQIRDDIKSFLNTLPKDVNLVVASKYIDSDNIRKLHLLGVNNFGENRVDSFLIKYENLKDWQDIEWHFIGHLQCNKAKQVINKINYLHSLDSLKLADIINKNRSTPLKCFVEVSINQEENKNGVSPIELESFLKEITKYKNIDIIGLMMMSIAHSSVDSLTSQFNSLVELANQMNEKNHYHLNCFSMGMSDDYQVAIKCHSTHIRLGRILFKD